MSALNSLLSKKIHSWDLTKGRFSEIDELPLMSSPGPMLVLLSAYLLFVLKIGPDFMTKKRPYKLTYTLLVYNAIQVIISAFMVHRYFNDLWDIGIFPRKCAFAEEKVRKHVIFSIWIYFAAKVTELLDTVFFVLRKKDNQVTFLHLYHHSIMFLGTWVMLKYWPSHNLIFIGFLNSLVHVMMYSYYGLSALGPGVAKYLTWKKYMTTFQLVQFVSIIVQYLVSVKVSECPPAKGIAFFIGGNTFFFLLLFLNFYRQSYIKKDKKKHNINDNDEADLTDDSTESIKVGNGKAYNKENGLKKLNKQKCK